MHHVALTSKRYLIAACGVAAGLLVGLVIFTAIRRLENQNAVASFQEVAHGRLANVTADIRSYAENAAVLGAFYNASDNVTRREFSIFATELFKQDHKIRALAWAPKVPARLRPRYEAAARRDGLAAFRISDIDSAGQMINAASRAVYFPAFFVEPQQGNERAIGYDLASEPTRAAALDRAADTGQIATTGRVDLLSDADQYGFLVIRPCYRSGASLANAEQRRSALKGFAVAVFGMRDVVEGRAVSKAAPSLRIAIFDQDAPAGQRRLYPKAEAFESTGDLPRGPLDVHTISAGGRNWQLIAYAQPAFSPVRWSSWATLAAELIILAFVMMYLRLLWHRELATERIVAQRTSELHSAAEKLELARKTAEKNETRYRKLLQISPDAILLCRDDDILMANEAAVQLFRAKSASELRGQSLAAFVVPDSRAGLEEACHNLSAAELRLPQREIQIVCGDAVTDVEMTAVSFLDDDGATAQFVVRDITERKRAEASLRSSEARLRGITDSAKDAILMMNHEGAISYWNPAAETLLGYPHDEAVGQQLHGLLAPERFLQAHQSALPEFVRTGRGNAVGKTLELPARRKDGTEITVDLSLSAIFLDGAWQAIGILRDITERKRTEARLLQATDRLTLATRAGGVGIWDWDIVHNDLVWDDQMLHLYGLTRDCSGSAYEAWRNGVHPQDRQRLDEEIQAAFQGTRDFNTEFRVIWPDGSVHSIRAMALLERDESGRPLHMIGTNWDITAQKQAADELRQTNRQLEEATARANQLAMAAAAANAAKSEFLAKMSHEIRTPMNGIIGMNDLLLRTELDQRQRRYSLVVRDSATVLLAVLDDILDFSKIEAGRLSLESTDFDLRGMFEGVIDLFAPKAQEKGLELLGFIEHDVPTQLRGDPTRLRQVLVNLLGNAMKFTRAGVVSARVALERSDETAVIRFEIRDTGVGVSAANRHRLFQPFSQADASTTRQFGGTGLGLTIVKRIVEAMGGKIDFESEEGRGSTFWFAVPFPVEAGSPLPLPLCLRGSRILVIDRHVAGRELLCRFLRHWQCEIAEAPDLDTAVELYARDRGHLDAAIFDIDTGEADTLRAAVRRLREEFKSPVIGLAPLGFLSGLEHSRDIDFAGVVTKPVKQGDLGNCLAAVLGHEPQSGKAAADEIKPRRTGEPSKADAKILVVEDNETNQEVITGILGQLGYSAVEIVSDGQQALDVLTQKDFDVVLMDCQLPGMDGYETTRRIRRLDSPVRNPDIAVIAMTAHALAGDRAKCLQAGMNDYVSKPIVYPMLQQALDRWLAPGAVPVNTGATATPASGAPVRLDFDPDDLLERLMGNTDLAQRVLKQFMETAPKDLAALAEAVNRSDTTAVSVVAHTIKGAAASAGSPQLSENARNIELAVKAGDLEQLRRLAPETEKCFDRFCAEVGDFLRESSF